MELGLYIVNVYRLIIKYYIIRTKRCRSEIEKILMPEEFFWKISNSGISKRSETRGVSAFGHPGQ